jgi:hypothetical protein
MPHLVSHVSSKYKQTKLQWYNVSKKVKRLSVVINIIDNIIIIDYQNNVKYLLCLGEIKLIIAKWI